ncbi:MAG: hypothetical protein JSW41_03620 [Candidatus Aenigmatarchaeota archaeon]|nr:MAG: hypothetical protein JSW41_03620 [Candidatus Aenigmarchaeota archaeon]
MVWVKLFKPTWGRIAIFIILFAAIALLDQTFLFFPESPLTYNVIDSAAIPFIVYLIVIPYIVSCVVPAFFIREFRHAKIHEFVEKHKKKPTVEGVIDTIEDYEQIQERYAKSLKKPFQKPEEKPKPKGSKKSRKSRTKRRK